MAFFTRSPQLRLRGWISAIAVFLCLGQGSSAFAVSIIGSDLSMSDAFLSDAMQIQVSDGGLEFISLNIEEILSSNGLILRTQRLDSFEQSASTPIRLDSIPAEYLGEKSTLADLASELPKWISGVTLHNPQPKFTLIAPQYQVLDAEDGTERAFFQVNPDLTATALLSASELGMGGGVVLSLRAHIPVLKISATELRISDPRNPDLRETSLTKPWVNLGGAGIPLELKAQVLVRGSAAGRVRLRVLSVDSNITKVPVQASFATLRVPQIKITVNGRTGFVMNQGALEGVLRARLPGLASIARVRVAAGLRESLPGLLEAKFNELVLKKDLGTAELALPGLAPQGRSQPSQYWLRLGLARAVLSQGWGWNPETNHLRLRFFSEWNSNLFESDLARAVRGLDSSLAPEDESIFDGAQVPIEQAAHVVAVLDPRIYNSVLADSWADGWRYQSAGLRLVDAPQVRLDEVPGGARSFLDAVVMRSPEGLIERQLFGACGAGASDDEFRVHAAVELTIRKSSRGGNSIDLLRGGLNLNETFIPTDQFSSCALNAMGLVAASDDLRRSLLTDQVNASLSKASKVMETSPEPIVEGLALPDSLLGMRLKLLGASLQNGRIYLQFKLDGVVE